VGDFISVVLADSVVGAGVVADSVAVVDTISDCGDSGGGVSGFD